MNNRLIRIRFIVLVLLVLMLLGVFTACTRSSHPNGESGLSEHENINDKPTIPEDVAEGIDYLYDFRFSERYDDQITEDFSLVLSEEAGDLGDELFLYEKYQGELDEGEAAVYDGDGMTPHKYKRHWNSFETGNLEIGTHYYEPDGVEYISYLWSDIEGVKTHRNIAVGSAEEDILSAYPDDLYYVEQESASPGFMEFRDNQDFDFDYAYTWQPFTAESNDIRDTTFYINAGRVAAIEMISPFELRYVYGYDREAGLQYVQEQRKK